MKIFRDWSIWYVDNFMKMPRQLPRAVVAAISVSRLRNHERQQHTNLHNLPHSKLTELNRKHPSCKWSSKKKGQRLIKSVNVSWTDLLL